MQIFVQQVQLLKKGKKKKKSNPFDQCFFHTLPDLHSICFRFFFFYIYNYKKL